MHCKQTALWDNMISSYANNPRDVITVPLNGSGIWFYVYVASGCIYVESAKKHTNSSMIRNRRMLEQEKAEAMLSLYYRRKRGEAVSREATATTQNQVYWYGIFADMGL